MIIDLHLRGTAGGPLNRPQTSEVGSKVWDGLHVGPLGVGLHARITAEPAPAPGTSYDNSVIIKTFFL